MNAQFSVQIPYCLSLVNTGLLHKPADETPSVEKALLLVPYYNNNLCCRASNKTEPQLHCPPSHLTQNVCLSILYPDYLPSQTMGVAMPAESLLTGEDAQDRFQKAEVEGGALTHRINGLENMHHWPQHTHHPPTHKVFSIWVGFFFF